MQSRVPSGLFPSGPHRPTYREPHPVRVTSVLVGAAMAFAWQFVVAGFATTLQNLFWRMVTAVLVALAVALLLLRYGDRGAATGVAMAASAGGCAAAVLVAVRWLTVGWPLW